MVRKLHYDTSSMDGSSDSSTESDASTIIESPKKKRYCPAENKANHCRTKCVNCRCRRSSRNVPAICKGLLRKWDEAVKQKRLNFNYYLFSGNQQPLPLQIYSPPRLMNVTNDATVGEFFYKNVPVMDKAMTTLELELKFRMQIDQGQFDNIEEKDRSILWMRMEEFNLSMPIYKLKNGYLEKISAFFADAYSKTGEMNFGIDEYPFSGYNLHKVNELLRKIPTVPNCSQYWFSTGDILVYFTGNHMKVKRIHSQFHYVREWLKLSNKLHFGVDELQFTKISSKKFSTLNEKDWMSAIHIPNVIICNAVIPRMLNKHENELQQGNLELQNGIENVLPEANEGGVLERYESMSDLISDVPNPDIDTTGLVELEQCEHTDDNATESEEILGCQQEIEEFEHHDQYQQIKVEYNEDYIKIYNDAEYDPELQEVLDLSVDDDEDEDEDEEPDDNISNVIKEERIFDRFDRQEDKVKVEFINNDGCITILRNRRLHGVHSYMG